MTRTLRVLRIQDDFYLCTKHEKQLFEKRSRFIQRVLLVLLIAFTWTVLVLVAFAGQRRAEYRAASNQPTDGQTLR